MRSRLKRTEPFSALSSKTLWFLRPAAKRVDSSVPIAPFSNSTAAAKASSTSTTPVPPSPLSRSLIKVCQAADALEPPTR